ncbi:hypothetical protein ACFZCL_04225 [Streptomyces sp. NPDC008159]|uniref:hypothetical protein n=1 Tax=Streptomyces sp. NPDC008159 TaxID=3364817 RepID=UPI0036E195CA
MTSEMQRAVHSGTAPTSQLVMDLADPVTTSAGQLVDPVEQTGSLRTTSKEMHETYSQRHKRELYQSWQAQTAARGKQAPGTLLEEIADLGFAWRDVARMVSVSVPAVQKWRRSGGVTGENRRRLAGLLALCDEITGRYHIQEVASWFEMPIASRAPVTPIDLYSEGRHDLVLEHASGHSDVEQILTAYDPDWRERFHSDFEVYMDVDGEMSIRPKGA